MNLQPAEIYEHERAKWISTAGKRKTFATRFTDVLPLLIIIIQAAMFLVSAKHTSDMINLIAPGMGWAGVIGFELGLVVFSLLIYQAGETDGAAGQTWKGLEIGLFVMIVLSNVAGSVEAIAVTTGIKELSFAAVGQAFGGLPLSTQTGLVVGLAFAVAVPLLFVATGQAFARIILSASDGNDPLESKWQSNGYQPVYRAIYAQLLDRGVPSDEARAVAKQLTSGLFGKAQRGPSINAPRQPVALLSKGSAGQALDSLHTGEGVQSVSLTGIGQLESARQYVTENPDAIQLSVRKLAEAAGVSKSTAATVKRELTPSNGKVHMEQSERAIAELEA